MTNLNSLYPEIYNGYKWAKLKYLNSDSEIKQISINYSHNSLIPPFNPRILNYTCNYNNSMFPLDLYFVNPPLHKITLQKNTLQLFTNINTTYDFIPFNYKLTNNIINNNNIILQSENIHDSTINIQYTIKFNYN